MTLSSILLCHSGKSCYYRADKWNIARHISKQKMPQSSEIADTADGELVSPEDTGPR